MVTTGFYAKDQQRFFLKLKRQLRSALHIKDEGQRLIALQAVAGRLFKHLSASAQQHDDPLQLVFKVAQRFGIDMNSPQGRIIRAYAPVGARAVQGGLVGSTKG